MMRVVWRSLRLIAVFFLCSYPVLGWALENPSVARQYQQLKEAHEKRVSDFYERMIDKERYEAEQRRGAIETRRHRKIDSEKLKEARVEYIKNRERPPSIDSQKWEKEIQLRQEQHEKERREYAQRQHMLSRLLKGLWQIPEEEEFDLYPPEADSAP